MEDTTEATDFAEVITNIARREATTVMDPRDLEQELWVFFLERNQSIVNEGQMVTLLKKQSRAITKKERIDYMYFRGAFLYTPGMVRRLLEDAVWCDVEDVVDIEGRVDVSTALAELTDRERRLLYAKFHLGEEVDGDKANKRALYRAIDKITDHLNLNTEAEEVDATYVLDPHTLGGSSF
ncbi:hypothetical protein GCM10009700_35140 [Brevibacterium sanguinis]|uniref:hypothetical protein n=1 Tax=Brevibacterium sanguinis TaxID=232444 RepID=UPI0031D27FD5